MTRWYRERGVSEEFAEEREEDGFLLLCVSFWVFNESRGMGVLAGPRGTGVPVFYSQLTVIFFKVETVSFGGCLEACSRVIMVLMMVLILEMTG